MKAKQQLTHRFALLSVPLFGRRFKRAEEVKLGCAVLVRVGDLAEGILQQWSAMSQACLVVLLLQRVQFCSNALLTTQQTKIERTVLVRLLTDIANII